MSVILCFGDSITMGAWDEEGGWVARLNKYAIKKMMDNNLSYYHQVYNLGISGDTTTELLKRFEKELSARTQREEESRHIILFAIGINDSYTFVSQGIENVLLTDFQTNLERLAALAKKDTSDIVFVGLTPVDESIVNPVPWRTEIAYKNELIKKYNEALKTFCNNQQLIFINFFDEFMKKDYKSLLIDGLHPNTKGHELMSLLITKSLEENILI